ncbi:MAG: SDR family oxidoreductase [Candidatus Protistobacter heckmanni]|nr:SDR family oxidoreductase [Candidatus Protistobacter heckmanni]
MKKSLLVTGGGSGIGAAVARLAAADAVLADIAKAGGNAFAVQADVSREEGVLRLFKEADARLGPLTALVNNAGMIEPQTRVENMDAARLTRVFATNVVGSFLCAHEAVLRMSTKRGGKDGAIVNISSRAAGLGSPNEFVDYAASKGAIETFTICLAKEVATEGIRVNAVRPGLIHADIHASGGGPEEVAQSLLWLLSDASSYVTSTFIDVSGGR